MKRNNLYSSSELIFFLWIKEEAVTLTVFLHLLATFAPHLMNIPEIV